MDHNTACSVDRAQLALHGYPGVSIAGARVPLKLKHGLALLAYLSLRAQPVGRDTLAALLWPDAPAGRSRARLRRLAHELNGRLGCGVVGGDADALWLAAGCTSDVDRTRAAIAVADREALGLLCAPQAAELLEGFSLASDAFDDWLDTERRAQHAALARALERAIDTALAQRDTAAAERGAQALLRLDACAEAGHGALIAARALRGDAAGVEAAYFAGAERWRDEYGSRPSARIEAAYALARARLHDGGGRREASFFRLAPAVLRTFNGRPAAMIFSATPTGVFE